MIKIKDIRLGNELLNTYKYNFKTRPHFIVKNKNQVLYSSISSRMAINNLKYANK